MFFAKVKAGPKADSGAIALIGFDIDDKPQPPSDRDLAKGRRGM
jgi:hypothetical protein